MRLILVFAGVVGVGVDVDEPGLQLGIENGLAGIESLIAGEHIAECNRKKQEWHCSKAEHFKADQQRSNRAVSDTTENGGHTDGGT